MKISVILPVYNAEEFLSETLESLVNQTLDNDEYEIIIINDGSTDGSQEIIDSYQAKYSNIVAIQQENKGVSATRNRAIDLAKADYIACMDADDVCYRERLAIQYDYMQQHQLDLCSSFFDIIDADNKVIGKITYPVQHETCKECLISAGRNIICQPAAMFNKNLVTKIGGYHHSLKLAEDYDLWLRIVENNGRLGNVPQYLVQYRQHETNVTALNLHESLINALVARYAYNLRVLGMKDGQNKGIDIDYLMQNLPANLQQQFQIDYFDARHFYVSVGNRVGVDRAIKEFATVKYFANRAYKAKFYLRVGKGYFINKAYGRFILYLMLGIATDSKQLAILMKIFLSNRMPYAWKKY